MYKRLKNGLTGLLILSLGIGAVSSCAKMCSRTQSIESAVSTPLINESSTFCMRHQALNGLYLTIEESRRREDNGRQITFFDYGFDGKLDRIRILQDNKRKNIVTNPVELAKWQPLFEQMRLRRFGSYTPQKHPYD